jgi:hypothetical protein
MDHQDALYPFELLPLLEALCAENFTGRVDLEADSGMWVIHFVDGLPRYATTTDVTDSFPAYLITEGIFPRERVRHWLETCASQETTLEDTLLGEGIIDPDGLLQLKADMSRSVFAHTFAIRSMARVHRGMGISPDFGRLLLDPYEAVFHSASGQSLTPNMLDAFQDLWRKPMRPGPAFFTLLPTFRRYFRNVSLPADLSDTPSLHQLTDGGSHDESVIVPAFVMRLTGMLYLEGEEHNEALILKRSMGCRLEHTPQPADPDARLVERALTRSGLGPSLGETRTRPKKRVRAVTQPGLPVTLADLKRENLVPTSVLSPSKAAVDPLAPMEAQDLGHAKTRPTSTTNPSVRPKAKVPPPVPREVSASAGREDSDAMSFADLRGRLIGQGIIDNAEELSGLDHYSYLGLTPRATPSEIRLGYLRTFRRYDPENHRGALLHSRAVAALGFLQKRTEQAYEELTDLRTRIEHDRQHGINDGYSRQEMEALFYAEGVFKAAQIRMAQGDAEPALDLLKEALKAYPDDPEYLSYMAWGCYSSGIEKTELNGVQMDPKALLKRALEMNANLESAWLFKARVAAQQGKSKEAITAYYEVLNANADNEEAKENIEHLREQGVGITSETRMGVGQRIARILNRS